MCNHFRGSMHLCTHHCCTLPPGPHRPRPFCIWKVLMNRGGSDGSSLQQQVHEWRLCVFSSHLLSLSLRQEKGGLTCHMTGVTCHSCRGMRTRIRLGGAEDAWSPVTTLNSSRMCLDLPQEAVILALPRLPRLHTIEYACAECL